mgnify:CR=1 FL=1
MANIIKQHNSRTLQKKLTIKEKSCNYKADKECPMNGKCLTKCIVYKTEVETTNSMRIYVYFGASEGEFNHTKSFRNRKCTNDS